jgi:luciferase family oxidoreductase group 1
VPGAGLKVPIWLLGSSLYSAQLAAMLGLPFAFAAHFAPELLLHALAAYRSRFAPSAHLQAPYAMICVNVVTADSDREAQRLFSSHQQAFTQLRRGRPGRLPPPIDDMEAFWSPEERALIGQSMHYSFVGSPDTVRAGLESFLAQTRPQELMVNVHVFDQPARRRSLALTAELLSRA